MNAVERWSAYQFLLPSTAEIVGIASEGWVEPGSLKAKTTILRLLGWDKKPPVPPTPEQENDSE